MPYKKIDPEDIANLSRLLSPDRVHAGAEISEDYQHDELANVKVSPEILLEPVSTLEVSRIMEYACERSIPVTPRGQGTGLVGGAVAVKGGIMLDLSRMNKILELDEENLCLTVEPGVILMDLYQFVEQKGFYYPPNPGEKSASIGGNVSTNAGGMSAVKYGVTRDYVKGLEVVLPDGRIITLGGKLMKNSSGYDLKELFVGAEGTLGIITKIVLKLLPLPAASLSVLVPFGSLREAIQCVPQILKAKVIPRSLEFMEQEVILMSEDYLGKKFPDHSAPAYLMLAFDGASRKQLECELDAAAKVCLQNGAVDVLIADTDERSSMIWTARGAFLEAIKASTTEMDECDVVIPRNRIAEFIAFTKELSQQYRIRIFSFGHAGDGNLHIYILRDDLQSAEWEHRLGQVFDKLYARADEMNGAVSGEHGIGYAKKKYLEKALPPATMHLMAGIKQLFDPRGILNPAKVVDAGIKPGEKAN